jgi:hypothetical protein
MGIIETTPCKYTVELVHGYSSHLIKLIDLHPYVYRIESLIDFSDGTFNVTTFNWKL